MAAISKLEIQDKHPLSHAFCERILRHHALRDLMERNAPYFIYFLIEKQKTGKPKTDKSRQNNFKYQLK